MWGGEWLLGKQPTVPHSRVFRFFWSSFFAISTWLYLIIIVISDDSLSAFYMLKTKEVLYINSHSILITVL